MKEAQKDMHAVIDVRCCACWCYMRKPRIDVGRGGAGGEGVAEGEGIR